MATEAADPREFSAWSDAFKYPVPTVRAMEKKLRGGIVENQDKLRTLVGASYRDLLGTATTIIDISDKMHKVESLLTESGKKCDSRALNRVEDNCVRFLNEERSKKSQRFASASQLQTLQNCLKIISKQLSHNGPGLHIAKLLVIARLLHKSLAESQHPPPLVNILASKLAWLRQKLLKILDLRLAQSSITISDLVQDMTAFSLATSSTPSIVIAHFHRLRSEVITRTNRNENQSTNEAINAKLVCFLSTVRQSRRIFPDLLAASLKTLAAQALLDDPAVKNSEDLSLDLHARWLTDDVRNYTPWTRHSDLSKDKASQSIETWASDTLDAMCRNLKVDLSQVSDLKEIIDIRNQALQVWLSLNFKDRAFDQKKALLHLREPFMQRALELVSQLYTSFDSTILGSFEDSLSLGGQASDRIQSLWDPLLMSKDIREGAATFRKDLVRRRMGRDTNVESLLKAFEIASNPIREMPSIVKAMRDTRWQDDFDEDEESDEDEEEDDHDHDQTPSTIDGLSSIDPTNFETAIHDQAKSTFNALQSNLISILANESLDCKTPNSTGLLFLRMLREMRHRLPQLLHPLSLNTSIPFCQPLVDTLLTSLATHISTSTSPTLVTLLHRFSTRPLHSHALWHGTPALPIQPSVATFSHLRNVTHAMEVLGPDLWTPPALAILRSQLYTALVPRFEAAIDSISKVAKSVTSAESGTEATEREVSSDDTTIANTTIDTSTTGTNDLVIASTTNGHESAEASTSPVASSSPTASETPALMPTTASAGSTTRLKLTQLLFDTFYLRAALSPASAGSVDLLEPSDLAQLAARLESTSEISSDEVSRLRKSADEYWRRTFLLFGLLAS